MRPGLTREIVRNGSAYKLARHIVDGFLLAELAVMVIAIVWMLSGPAGEPEPNKFLIVGVSCGTVVVTASAVLQRELLHALLDIADCALLKSKIPSEDENPFK